MVAEIFDSSVCACYGHRCPHSDIQIGLKDTIDPNILETIISCETETIKRSSRIVYPLVQMIMLFTIRTLENRLLTFVIYVINL